MIVDTLGVYCMSLNKEIFYNDSFHSARSNENGSLAIILLKSLSLHNACDFMFYRTIFALLEILRHKNRHMFLNDVNFYLVIDIKIIFWVYDYGVMTCLAIARVSGRTCS